MADRFLLSEISIAVIHVGHMTEFLMDMKYTL